MRSTSDEGHVNGSPDGIFAILRDVAVATTSGRPTRSLSSVISLSAPHLRTASASAPETSPPNILKDMRCENLKYRIAKTDKIPFAFVLLFSLSKTKQQKTHGLYTVRSGDQVLSAVCAISNPAESLTHFRATIRH